MTSGRSDIIDIAGEKTAETDKAIRWFDGKIEAWVPKSQVEWSEDDSTLAMPEWLAKDKGFI
jgi:hypothetical protein